MAAKLLKKTISAGTELVVQANRKRSVDYLSQYQEVEEGEGNQQCESREVTVVSTQIANGE